LKEKILNIVDQMNLGMLFLFFFDFLEKVNICGFLKKNTLEMEFS